MSGAPKEIYPDQQKPKVQTRGLPRGDEFLNPRDSKGKLDDCFSDVIEISVFPLRLLQSKIISNGIDDL